MGKTCCMSSSSLLESFRRLTSLEDLPPARTSLNVIVVDMSEAVDQAVASFESSEDVEVHNLRIEVLRQLESKCRKANDDESSTKLTIFILKQCKTSLVDRTMRAFKRVNNSTRVIAAIARYVIEVAGDCDIKENKEDLKVLAEYMNGKSQLEAEYATLLLLLLPHEENKAGFIGLVPMESFLTLNEEYIFGFIVLQMEVLQESDTLLAESKAKRIPANALEFYPELLERYHTILLNINSKLGAVQAVACSLETLSRGRTSLTPEKYGYFALFIVCSLISRKHTVEELLACDPSFLIKHFSRLHQFLLRLNLNELITFPLVDAIDINKIPEIQDLFMKYPDWEKQLQHQVQLINLEFVVSHATSVSLNSLCALLHVEKPKLHILLKDMIDTSNQRMKIDATSDILSVDSGACTHTSRIDAFLEDFKKTSRLMEETMVLIEKEKLLIVN